MWVLTKDLPNVVQEKSHQHLQEEEGACVRGGGDDEHYVRNVSGH